MLAKNCKQMQYWRKITLPKRKTVRRIKGLNQTGKYQNGGSKMLHINNYHKYKWIKFHKKKTQNHKMALKKKKPNNMLFKRKPLHL